MTPTELVLPPPNPFWPLSLAGEGLVLPSHVLGSVYDDVEIKDEGKVYAIPFVNRSHVIWYNKALFREQQWAIPRTWDELFSLCEQIKAAGVPPFAFQGAEPSYATMLLFAAYYQIAGLQAISDQQQLVPGAFDNAAFEQAAALTQRLALNYFQPGAIDPVENSGPISSRSPVMVPKAVADSAKNELTPTGARHGGSPICEPSGQSILS